MSVKLRRLRVAFLSVGLSAAILSPAYAAPADQQSDVSKAEAQVAPQHHDLIQGAHVEGHIAFMRAELGITQAQEGAWNNVAQAMREDVQNLHDAEESARQAMHGPENAVQYLHNRAMFAQLRAQGEVRFLAAFKPLYEKLSEQQKQVADDLLIPHDDQ